MDPTKTLRQITINFPQNRIRYCEIPSLDIANKLKELPSVNIDLILQQQGYQYKIKYTLSLEEQKINHGLLMMTLYESEKHISIEDGDQHEKATLERYEQIHRFLKEDNCRLYIFGDYAMGLEEITE